MEYVCDTALLVRGGGASSLMSQDFLQGFAPVSPALPVWEELPVRKELPVWEDCGYIRTGARSASPLRD